VIGRWAGSTSCRSAAAPPSSPDRAAAANLAYNRRAEESMVNAGPPLPKSLLEHAYHWERTTPNQPYLTQPLGAGVVKDWTWRTAMDEARRMAAHLRSLALPPGSNIALLSRNCAHWIMADLA